MERAEQLRPNCRIETETRLQWLRETDALLRTKLFDRSAAGAFDAVGADRPWEQPVQDDQTLLAPPPFDALYPHLLCAQMDAALGETDRYAGGAGTVQRSVRRVGGLAAAELPAPQPAQCAGKGG